MANDLAPTWVTKAGFGVLTLNSGLAIYRSWGDLVSILFVVAGSYTTLIFLFLCLRNYERAAPGSPARERARRTVWPLTTLPRLVLGVVNCDMALTIHKARSEPGTATCVLVSYVALLALVWVSVRELAGQLANHTGSSATDRIQGQGRSG